MSASNFGHPAWQLGELRGVFGGHGGPGRCVPLGKGGAAALRVGARPPVRVMQPRFGFSWLSPTLPSQAAYTCLFVFDCLRFSEFD